MIKLQSMANWLKLRRKIYLMMNKPRGVVTTASDEKGRETVYATLNAKFAAKKDSPPTNPPWVAPVGRLDKASEGLLLLTNDSEWGARITAPETHLDKTYHVQVGTVADEEFIQALVHGVKAERWRSVAGEAGSPAACRARKTAGLRLFSMKARIARSAA